MQYELVNWLIQDGGLVILSIFVAGLFVVQAVFTFLLWRKGDKTYLFKFIIYALAGAAILIADFGFILGPVNQVITEEAWIANVSIFLVVACVAAGMGIFFFIRDTWVRKEGGKA